MKQKTFWLTVVGSIFIFGINQKVVSDDSMSNIEQSLVEQTDSTQLETSTTINSGVTEESDYNNQETASTFSQSIKSQETVESSETLTPLVDETTVTLLEKEIYFSVSHVADIFDESLEVKIDTTKNMLNTTVLSKKSIKKNDSIYYELQDASKKILGFVSEDALISLKNGAGQYHSYGKMVAIKDKKQKLWQNFNWDIRTNAKEFYGKPLKARGYYNHFDGKRYLSLYDNKGKWIGYIDEMATVEIANQAGFYQSYGKYITIKVKNYDLWQNFNWKKRNKSVDYYGKSLQARGYYDHYNGSRYLSVYDNKGYWVGYINEKGTELSNGKVGFYQPYGKYVTVKKNNYDLWQNFNWKSRNHSSKYVGKTLQARGYYDHYNGNRYLSVYDNKGYWVGYINQSGVSVAKGAQGIYKSYGKYVTVTKKNYNSWQNFNWKKKKKNASIYKTTYLAKGQYQHFNGSRYLSLYDAKGKWQGYINANGTSPAKSPQEKMKTVQKMLSKDYNSKNYGIYILSPVDGSHAAINGNTKFHAASTGKLPALYYTQKRISDKKLEPNRKYTYSDKINKMTNSYMRGGAGILQGKSYGNKYSLDTIMKWTAKYSDNQGANFLGYYGANQYDATMKKEIGRVMGRKWTSPFYVTAKDNALIMKAIYDQDAKLVDYLSDTVYDNQRIPKYLPVQVAHKIGDVDDLRHDVAIVYVGQPYVISILTKNNQSYEAISQLSKKVYNILK